MITQKDIKEKTGIEANNTTAYRSESGEVYNRRVSAEFHINGYNAEIFYTIGRKEMNLQIYKDKKSAGMETFNYGEELKESDLFEAIEFAHGYLKENL